MIRRDPREIRACKIIIPLAWKFRWLRPFFFSFPDASIGLIDDPLTKLNAIDLVSDGYRDSCSPTSHNLPIYQNA